MYKSKSSKKGFTLIEVSLAIVIGVIVLAGAITLYNQTKINAGNSKAGEKVAALATLVEEMMSTNNGIQPTFTALGNNWSSRRDDTQVSPWGGALAATAYNGLNQMGNPWGQRPAVVTIATPASDSVGALQYASSDTNVAVAAVWDQSAGATKNVRLYWVGAVEPGQAAGSARFSSFVVGGK